MLAQTVVLVALLALFATAATVEIAGAGRAQSAAVAKALVVPAVEAALARYEATVGAAIAAQAAQTTSVLNGPVAAVAALNGGTTWPEQRYVEAAGDGVPFSVVVDVAPTVGSEPACMPSDGPVNTGPDLEIDGQCSSVVQESRLSLTVTTDVGPLDVGGVPSALAHDRLIVTLRLFAQAPYVIPVGTKDAALPGDPHEGDEGGYGGALLAFAPPAPAADDTTIHVLYSCSPALGDCTASAPPPADLPTSLPWYDANQAAAGL